MSKPSFRNRRYSRESFARDVPFVEGFRDSYARNEAIRHGPDPKRSSNFWKWLKWTLYAIMSVAIGLGFIFTLDFFGGCDDCSQQLRNDPFCILMRLLVGVVFTLCILAMLAVGVAEFQDLPRARRWKGYGKERNA